MNKGTVGCLTIGLSKCSKHVRKCTVLFTKLTKKKRQKLNFNRKKCLSIAELNTLSNK